MYKFRGKYRVASNRLHDWDYGSHGLYFVTICTQQKHPYFGNIVEPQYFASPTLDKKKNSPAPTQHEKQDPAAPGHKETHNKGASMKLRDIGRIAYSYWSDIPSHYPFIELDEFVVMPNHVHGILFFNRPDYHDWQPNTFGPQSGNLGAILRGYKAAVKKYATLHQIPFGWQSRYHDHIIRSERSLNHIRAYIRKTLPPGPTIASTPPKQLPPNSVETRYLASQFNMRLNLTYISIYMCPNSKRKHCALRLNSIFLSLKRRCISPQFNTFCSIHTGDAKFILETQNIASLQKGGV